MTLSPSTTSPSRTCWAGCPGPARRMSRASSASSDTSSCYTSSSGMSVPFNPSQTAICLGHPVALSPIPPRIPAPPEPEARNVLHRAGLSQADRGRLLRPDGFKLLEEGSVRLGTGGEGSTPRAASGPRLRRRKRRYILSLLLLNMRTQKNKTFLYEFI